MATLEEFLLARIAEDEAAARKSTPAPWKLWGMRVMADTGGDSQVDHATPVADTYSGPQLRTWNAHHIILWQPARVLAECEAKRRIVDLYDSVCRDAAHMTEWPVRQFVQGRLILAEATLRDLALPYADHPDYEEEWR